ncbi:MAG: alpha/beta hydrolase, partial [Planctomycetes bacterium]|nr:alpha/beta hydrolase [Planctomycetota bacterium]
DAIRFVRERGPELFHADPNRIAVAGTSAGGYLTLTTGFRTTPRPVALVSIYGYGNLLAPWYMEPSPHARHNGQKVTREEALQQISSKPVADDRDRTGAGFKFYFYSRQQGNWPQIVSGWDPRLTPEKFNLYMPIKNVTSDYPPTLLVHGDNDTDVPHYESVLMAAELKYRKVEHEFISVAGGEHGFGGADPQAVNNAYQKAFQFLRKRLSIKTGNE